MKNSNVSCLIGTCILSAVTMALCQTDSRPAPSPPPFGGQAPSLPDLVKSVVLGQLMKIEKAKLTIAKPDGVEQPVAVDANTKFVGDGGNATKLEDFKTGDHVAATGALKDGVFVAAQLTKIPAGPGAPPPPPVPNRGSN